MVTEITDSTKTTLVTKMAKKLNTTQMKGTVPIFGPADDLRAILTGEATDLNAPRSQFRLSDIRELWDRTDGELHYALIRLVEDGEIAIFPVGDVTKIRLQ